MFTSKIIALALAIIFTQVATAVLTGGLGVQAIASEVLPEQDAKNRINLSGRQRMLTQQIARNACFVMAGIDAERFAAKADAAIRQFSVTLAGLRQGNENLQLLPESNQDVLDELAKVEALWRTLGAASQQIVAGDLHSVPMRQMVTLNMETMRTMNVAVKQIEKSYGSDILPADLAYTINLAGRQRMLSQKVAKEACFYMIGLTHVASLEQIDETMSEFEAVMDLLLTGAPDQQIIAPPNRRLKKQLERTSKAWTGFKTLMIRAKLDKEMTQGERVQMANMSDQVLREMNLAVQMYSTQ